MGLVDSITETGFLSQRWGLALMDCWQMILVAGGRLHLRVVWASSRLKLGERGLCPFLTYSVDVFGPFSVDLFGSLWDYMAGFGYALDRMRRADHCADVSGKKNSGARFIPG